MGDFACKIIYTFCREEVASLFNAQQHSHEYHYFGHWRFGYWGSTVLWGKMRCLIHSLHYRIHPLTQKIGQATPVEPAYMQSIQVKIFQLPINMGMSVRSLILLHATQPTVPSACKYSATLVKQIVVISSVKSALDESKSHRNKHAQSVISQWALLFKTSTFSES